MVTLPYSATHSLSSYANDFTATSNGCRGSQGRDRMVRFSVPAGQRVVVTVTPTVSTFDPMVSLVAGPASACVGSTATCVASADALADNGAETATWTNTGTSAVDVFAIVDDYDAQSTNGAYQLVIELRPAPAGETCETALVGASGVAITRTATDFANEYSGATGGCVTPSQGPDFVVAYTVPNNQSLTVTATPGASVDVSLNVATSIGACNGRTCVAATARGGNNGATEQLGWNNTTGATVTAYVIVDTAASPSGTVSVTGTLGALLGCGPLTCASGCCAAGTCVAGTSDGACGGGGASCSACTSPNICNSNQVCAANNLPTGAACNAASQCYQPLVGSAECRTSWPNGYCTSLCLLSDEVCGGFGGGATGYCTSNLECLQACSAPGGGQSSCRAGYVCDFAPGVSRGVCVPRCPTVACASGTSCNAQGYCR